MPRITKEARIHFVATRGQAARWRLEADEAGVTLAEWLRQCAERCMAERRESAQPYQAA